MKRNASACTHHKVHQRSPCNGTPLVLVGVSPVAVDDRAHQQRHDSAKVRETDEEYQPGAEGSPRTWAEEVTNYQNGRYQRD